MSGRVGRAVVIVAVCLPLLCMVADYVNEALYWSHDRERRQRRAAERETAQRNGTECNDSFCRTCSLLKRLDEACGERLLAQCGADAGHQFFTAADPFPERAYFKEETRCADGLVALTSVGSLEAPPLVRHFRLIKSGIEDRLLEVSLASNRARSSSDVSCGSCEVDLRLSASGWVRVQ